jgi:hypothetical protein
MGTYKRLWTRGMRRATGGAVLILTALIGEAAAVPLGPGGTATLLKLYRFEGLKRHFSCIISSL